MFGTVFSGGDGSRGRVFPFCFFRIFSWRFFPGLGGPGGGKAVFRGLSFAGVFFAYSDSRFVFVRVLFAGVSFALFLLGEDF